LIEKSMAALHVAVCLACDCLALHKISQYSFA
jgi:hypothetical protein